MTFTLTIPTTPVNLTDEHEGFVLATMLREIADRIDGGESEPMRTSRLDRLDPNAHPQINIVPTLNDGEEWITETYRYATRFNNTLVGAVYELTAEVSA